MDALIILGDFIKKTKKKRIRFMKGEFYRSIFNREEYREIKKIYKSVQSPEIQLAFDDVDKSVVIVLKSNSEKKPSYIR